MAGAPRTSVSSMDASTDEIIVNLETKSEAMTKVLKDNISLVFINDPFPFHNFIVMIN